MPDWSRRHALHAAGGLLATAVAGCQQRQRSDRPPGGSQRSVDDVTVLKVRNVAGEPMVVTDTGSPDSATDQPKQTDDPSRRGQVMKYLHEPLSEMEAPPRFPDDVPGATNIATVVAETSFDNESLYLLQSPIEECYDRHLLRVEADDGVSADFCQQLRPATVACETDTYDVLAFAIRLPFPADSASSRGRGLSSGCDGPEGSPIEPDRSLVVGKDGDGA